MSSVNGHRQAKPRKNAVKPILKRITHSEKNSLDLDRLAVEPDGFGGGGAGAAGGGGGLFEYGIPPRSSHDAVFNTTGRRGYHNRSTSGTSQFSTATAGSGHRGVSFVHPFQQTPRPYTPPLAPSISYQNSLRESEYSERESPALETSTEDEDQVRRPDLLRNHSSTNQTSPSLTNTSSPALLQEPLRIQTKSSPSRLALGTSSTSLHIHNPVGGLTANPELGSPSETMSPSSLRTSIEGFRLRSRSEAGDSHRPETIQEARRRFYEREQAKEEKLAREEIKIREKQAQKEARQIERKHRRSSAASEARSKRSKSKSDPSRNEKRSGSLTREHFQPGHNAYRYPHPYIEPPSKSFTKSAKKKTHSAWTKLMMWLRTRIIRMGRKHEYDQ